LGGQARSAIFSSASSFALDLEQSWFTFLAVTFLVWRRRHNCSWSHRNLLIVCDKQATSAIYASMNSDIRTPVTNQSHCQMSPEDVMDEQTIKLLMDVILSPDAIESLQQHDATVFSTGQTMRISGQEPTRAFQHSSAVHPSDGRFGGKPIHPYQTLAFTRHSTDMVVHPRWTPFYQEMEAFSMPFEPSLVMAPSDVRTADEEPDHPYERIMMKHAQQLSCALVTHNNLSPKILQSASKPTPSTFGAAASTHSSSFVARSFAPESADASNDQDDTEVESIKSIETGHVCNCKRNKCLKLYCRCFAAVSVGLPFSLPSSLPCLSRANLNFLAYLHQPKAVMCTPKGCGCNDCHNVTAHSKNRETAMKYVLSRYPGAFVANRPTRTEKRARMLQSADGQHCGCKKSKCLKKYCDCFYTNSLCTEECDCRNCENRE